MVEMSEDASVVSARMEREMRHAREEREARELREKQTVRVAALQESDDVLEGELRTEQSVSPSEPVDAGASFRYGRLGVVAVIVLVLFWLWVQERKSRK